MKFKTLITLAVVLLLIYSCKVQHRPNTSFTSNQLSQMQQRQLDSLLQLALDFEGLYTIYGRIKPMSSVASFSFPIANTDSLKRLEGEVLNLSAKQKYLDQLAELNTVVNSLNYPDIKFIISPYRQTYAEDRNIQLNVVRISLLDSLLQAEASFFGQFGLAPGADPAVVVATIENSDPYERWRGYGYLFGYPEYAVDFFVDASHHKMKTDAFVERNFFQIPSFARDSGTFVYAYPKDYIPNQIDSTLYFRAQAVLTDYTALRAHYVNKDSTLQARNLLQDYFYGAKSSR